MLNNLKEQIYDRVERWYKQRVGITRMQEMISNALNVDIPLELIREIIGEIKEWKQNSKEVKDIITEWTKDLEKKDGWLKDMVAGVWDEKLYDYIPETDHIVFYPDGKPYPILRTTVLAMHEKYTSDWENLSGKAMQQEFQLTPKARHYIKNVMNLYKDSVPFDKVTLSQLHPEEMQAIADKKAEQLTESKMRKEYDKSVIRSMKNSLVKYSKLNSAYDLFVDKLEKAIKLYQPLDFSKYKIPDVPNNKTKDVFITDAHLGKKWTDGIVIRFKKLTRDLIECEEKNINITFGWDIGELFLPLGEMHRGQRLGMEEISTEDLIMLAVDVLQNMLSDLYKSGKKVTFNGLGGNHDRFTEKKEFDPNRTPAMIIYRFLQRLVEDTNIKINILRDKANIIKSGKVKYIFIHWDSFSEAELKRRALNDIEDWYYLCYCTGDKHNFKMSELSDRIIWIQSPALAWPWQYDKSLALTSQSGAIFFEKNKDWMLEFTLKRYL